MINSLQINKLKQNITFFIVIVFSFVTLNAQNPGWVSCDFHQHTTFSDGSYSILYMMQKNAQYGLSWCANSEHGGGFNRNGLYSGYDIYNGKDAS